LSRRARGTVGRFASVTLTLNVERFHDLFDGYRDDLIHFHTPMHSCPASIARIGWQRSAGWISS
ncbi:MAG: hypothetical protein ACUVQI_09610, partial [Thermochromatium sp.]